MQLDRRRLFRAGIGTGLGASMLTLPAVQALAQSSSLGSSPKGASNQRLGPAAEPATTAPSVLHASDLGIRPDTGRDETVRLQGAIDRAAAERVPLQLASGRYIARSLRLHAGSRLAGTGRATVLQHLGGPALLIGDNLSGVTISDLAVTGGFPISDGTTHATAGGARRGLVEFRRTRDLSICGVTIEASTASGIVLERCSGRITECRIQGAAKAAIFSLDAEGGLEISHNEITRIGNNGILVWRSARGEDGTIVAFNRISHIAASDGGTGENGNAINAFRAGNVLVTSNRITDCAFSAVRANSASDVQILSNSIARMGEVAIFVEFAFEGAVVSGNLIDGASAGVSVTNFDHGGRLAVVAGNLIRNITLHKGPSDPGGYGIAVEADAAVTGNTIENAFTAGIGMGWGRFCRDVSATGNVIRKCTIGISVTSDPGAGTALIANNVISGSSRGAILGTDHGKPTTGDLALQPPARGRVSVTGNVTA